MTAPPGAAGAVRLTLGAPPGGRLSLCPRRRSHPDSVDFWEGNWLTADVAVEAGAFAGRFEAELRADELAGFAAQLEALEGAATGAAALQSAEGWVTIKLSPGRDGGLSGSCEVRDDPTAGSSLRFRLAVDRAQRAALLDGLAATLRAFPVVGDPAADVAGLLEGDPGPDPDPEPEPDRG